MIRLELLDQAGTNIQEVKPEELSNVIARPGNLLWIDLTRPTAEDWKLLAQEFQFHPLALEDAQKVGQRPKMDEYPTFLFIVFYSVEVVKDQGMFTTRQVSLFVGSNYLVTVHEEPVPQLQEVATRWRQNAADLKGRSVAILLYSVLDTIVDSYFPILDAIAEHIDDMEESIFGRSGRSALEPLFQMRKNLLALRRVIGPERDLMAMLVRRDLEVLGPTTAVYFQDVYDHVLRVTDSLDTYRDLLSGALDAYLSVVSNNLNQVMRTLTAWSIILMSLTLIPSIYGMNVKIWPPAGTRFGWDFALMVMVGIGGVLFALFKTINWL